MIIQIAGTSGSGKSTVVRGFLKLAEKRGKVEPVTSPNDRVVGYRVRLHRRPPIYVLGVYESPTGGCDASFKRVEEVFEVVRARHAAGEDVRYEGLFVMNHTRGPELATEVGENLIILQLPPPLATCLKSVDARRAERGAGPLQQKHNTEGNHVRARNYCVKMRGAGATVLRVSREEALDQLLELLDVQ
jgi:hypothetical protein